MITTLLQIEKWHPCEWGWKKLLNHLGKTEADEEELSIKTILESNGIKDAVWALRAVNGKDKEIRLFAADVAESVLHIYEKEYPNDDRPRKAIQAARDYSNGLIDDIALAAAWSAAGDAARASAGAAAGGAARAAVWAAAWDTAWAAAWSAAGDAARASAGAAAGDAARAAVWAAAWDTARAAAGDAARASAGAEKWQEIETILLKYLNHKP